MNYQPSFREALAFSWQILDQIFGEQPTFANFSYSSFALTLEISALSARCGGGNLMLNDLCHAKFTVSAKGCITLDNHR